MNSSVRETVTLGGRFVRWCSLIGATGLAVGSACALFLSSLELVTNLQMQHGWLLWLLPLAGAVVGLMYSAFGRNSDRGNNLIIDEIHEPGAGVPLRMAPLVLLGTLLTHLCGGSAGREGTAVQMGGSLAGGLARWMPGLSKEDIQTLLMAGVAAGFSGVFGTPVAGTIFALEVHTRGRMSHAPILPCLGAAVISDQTCAAWGIGHTGYNVASRLQESSGLHLAPVELQLILFTVVAGALFGLTSQLFSRAAHAASGLFKRLVSSPVLRPAIGGICVITLTLLAGTRDYLGLGVSSSDPEAVTIVRCFSAGGADTWSWAWKLLFTVVTLGSGFRGGEVTPLFFIGAALGNTLAELWGLPVDLFAALGFVAVFSGATKTPIACILMSVELFGGEYVLYFTVAVLTAWPCSGSSGIYTSQRTAQSKIVRRIDC